MMLVANVFLGLCQRNWKDYEHHVDLWREFEAGLAPRFVESVTLSKQYGMEPEEREKKDNNNNINNNNNNNIIIIIIKHAHMCYQSIQARAALTEPLFSWHTSPTSSQGSAHGGRRCSQVHGCGGV